MPVRRQKRRTSSLEEMARSFPARGDLADKVVTLLVEDTWECG